MTADVTADFAVFAMPILYARDLNPLLLEASSDVHAAAPVGAIKLPSWWAKA